MLGLQSAIQKHNRKVAGRLNARANEIKRRISTITSTIASLEGRGAGGREGRHTLESSRVHSLESRALNFRGDAGETEGARERSDLDPSSNPPIEHTFDSPKCSPNPHPNPLLDPFPSILPSALPSPSSALNPGHVEETWERVILAEIFRSRLQQRCDLGGDSSGGTTIGGSVLSSTADSDRSCSGSSSNVSGISSSSIGGSDTGVCGVCTAGEQYVQFINHNFAAKKKASPQLNHFSPL